MIVELDLDKDTTFVLEMEIEGDINDKPEMRFCIEFDNYTLNLKGTKLDGNFYEITCPKLKGLTETGTYAANVEVYIGDKRFIPLTETVRVKQDIKPVVKLSEHKAAPAAPSITVKAATREISKTTETIKR